MATKLKRKTANQGLRSAGRALSRAERQLNALLMLARALPKNQPRQDIVRKLQAEAIT